MSGLINPWRGALAVGGFHYIEFTQDKFLKIDFTNTVSRVIHFNELPHHVLMALKPLNVVVVLYKNRKHGGYGSKSLSFNGNLGTTEYSEDMVGYVEKVYGLDNRRVAKAFFTLDNDWNQAIFAERMPYV